MPQEQIAEYLKKRLADQPATTSISGVPETISDAEMQRLSPAPKEEATGQPKTTSTSSFGFWDKIREAEQKTKSFRNAPANFLAGQAKGLASTVAGAASLGEKALNVATEKMFPNLGIKGSDQTVGQEMQEEFFKPEGAAQQAGFVTEQVGEFLVPGTAATRGLAATEKVVAKAPKLAQMAKGALEVGKKAVVEAADIAARTAAQRGDIDESVVESAVFGAAGPIVGKAFAKVKQTFPEIAKNLEKVNLRLTPVQKRDLGKKIDDTANFMLNRGITGTAEKRLERVDDIYYQMEPKLEKFLKETAKDRTLPKQKLLDDLEALKANYQNRIDSGDIEAQIDKIKTTLETKQGDAVTLDALNQLKRSTYDSAYNTAGSKVLDDVLADVGDVFRSNIEEGTKGLKIDGKDIAEFNKEYGTVINARKLLKAASSRKDVGFLGKIVASIAGASAGSLIPVPAVGSAVGAALGPSIAEVVAGTYVRSNAANLINKLGIKATPAQVNELLKGLSSQIIQALEGKREE